MLQRILHRRNRCLGVHGSLEKRFKWKKWRLFFLLLLSLLGGPHEQTCSRDLVGGCKVENNIFKFSQLWTNLLPRFGWWLQGRKQSSFRSYRFTVVCRVCVEMFCWSSYFCFCARVISSWEGFKQSYPASVIKGFTSGFILLWYLSVVTTFSIHHVG